MKKSRKVLITITNNDVSPRFDLTSEVLIAIVDSAGKITRKRTMVLPASSEENVCHLILSENVDAVICSGIEDEYYQYLTWKRVDVIDSVIGPFAQALASFAAGSLRSGDILEPKHNP